MTGDRSVELLARILKTNPDFGSAGYLAQPRRMLTGEELLAKLHMPNVPGPGPAQR